MNNNIELYFPKELTSTEKTFKLILECNKIIHKTHNKSVIFNFKSTRKFHTNLLAIFIYFFENLKNQKNNILILFRNNKQPCWNKAAFSIFSYYSSDKRALLKPRKIGYQNERETEDVIIKYLKSFNLQEYDKIKIIISELIANIKMHTLNQEGSISGYIDLNTNELIITIVNCDITINNKIKKTGKMNFSNDYEAILWALKRTNTTRDADETGGLGLYLLRKYMNELNGRFSILSGKCYLAFNQDSFDNENENRIEYTNYNEMDIPYNGNIISLFFPYIQNSFIENKITSDEIIKINNLLSKEKL